MTANLLILLLVLFPQEKPKEERIVAVIPDFYFSGSATKIFADIELNKPPTGSSRKYFIRAVDNFGRKSNELQEMSEEEFYDLTLLILKYGVLDNTTPSFHLNESYINFIRLLLKHGIISKSELAKLTKHYTTHNWIESAYYLDEAVPGLLSVDDWYDFYKQNRSQNPYFYALFRIKTAQLNEARESLEKLLPPIADENKFVDPFYFTACAKTYGALANKGVELPEKVQVFLLSACISYVGDFEHGIKAAYGTAGLPLPRKEIISSLLFKRLKDAEAEGGRISKIVSEFRGLGIDFPKGLAPAYRDELLKDFGDWEDIQYLEKIADEPTKPELWKKYGDRAYWWHRNKSRRKEHRDSGDYYHATVEAYKKAKDGGIKLDPEKVKYLIDEIKDFSVHIRDLITAYELAEYYPKSCIEIFENRSEAYNQLKAGVFYNGAGEMEWQTNEYGEPIIPFRDAIELAAWLENPERTRKLAGDIAKYALERLRKEGSEIYSWWLDQKASPLVLLMLMQNLESPIYRELEAILDIYERLGFKTGARSLAQHLHELGFELPARRAYHLGGLGKEAEDQHYSKRSDEYWKKKQMIFSFDVRRKAIRQLADKNK